MFRAGVNRCAADVGIACNQLDRGNDVAACSDLSIANKYPLSCRSSITVSSGFKTHALNWPTVAITGLASALVCTNTRVCRWTRRIGVCPVCIVAIPHYHDPKPLAAHGPAICRTDDVSSNPPVDQRALSATQPGQIHGLAWAENDAGLFAVNALQFQLG